MIHFDLFFKGVETNLLIYQKQLFVDGKISMCENYMIKLDQNKKFTNWVRVVKISTEKMYGSDHSVWMSQPCCIQKQNMAVTNHSLFKNTSIY